MFRRLTHNLLTIGLGSTLLLFANGCLVVKGSHRTINRRIETRFAVADPDFRETISHLLGAPLVPGNSIEELKNGVEIFPAMLRDIRNARHSITFENFIWRSGKLSTQFVNAFSERARAGVRVHVVVDAIGALFLDDADVFEMREAGVEFERYNRPRWYNVHELNHRTHRKLMIVDGRVGYIGGICIADEWMGNAEFPPLWRDTHYRVQGPVVAQMQGVFMDNWMEVRSEVLFGEEYFPETTNAGPAVAQAFKSGPGEGTEDARLLYLLSIASARHHIRLAHSYFVPDDLAVEMLVAARKRGVQIEIITPGIIDANVVRRASRSRWGKLMEAGVEFYEYQPTLYHNKFMVVDDVWVTAGSINFDDRSFRINDEANINVLDRDFAAVQIASFEADKAVSRRLTQKHYRARSLFIKCIEHFAGLFRSQL